MGKGNQINMNITVTDENQIQVQIINELGKVKKDNEMAYDLLIENIKNGFFEQYQTKGKIDNLAKNLIKTVLEDEDFNED